MNASARHPMTWKCFGIMFVFSFLGFARIIPYAHTQINAQTGKFQAIKNTNFKHGQLKRRMVLL
jgi:hypothetical protein